jgi:hypothetical protein
MSNNSSPGGSKSGSRRESGVFEVSISPVVPISDPSDDSDSESPTSPQVKTGKTFSDNQSNNNQLS